MTYIGGYASGYADGAGEIVNGTLTDTLRATDTITAVRSAVARVETLPEAITATDSITVLRAVAGSKYANGYTGGYGPAVSGEIVRTLADTLALTDGLSSTRSGPAAVTLAEAVRGTDALTASRTTAPPAVDVPARMRLRLVAYNPGGSKRGDVPFGLALSRYTQMGEVPTAEAEYSFLQRNVQHLNGPVEVAVQYSDVAGQWVEPLNARYLIDKDDYDRLDNGQLIHRYSFLGYATQLRYVNLVGGLSTDLGLLDADGRRSFKALTPGAVMLLIIDDAKARGYIPAVNIGFTANLTSDGQPWAKVLTRSWPGEADALTVLQELHSGGWVDFWFDGRTLHMSNPDTTLGRDLSTGISPVYVRDQTLTSSPESVTYGDMITKVMVVGENGFRMLRNNPAASRAFGERVVTLAVGGVGDEATAHIQAEALLQQGSNPSRSLSREYTVTEYTKYAPERDYRTGDWIKADTATQQGERMRAFATSVREESGEVKAFVTLGTVHDDLLLRLAKRQNGLAGGSGVNNGGTPAPIILDQAVPKAPLGLVVDGDAYNDNFGFAWAIISATWSAVTEATGGGGVDVAGYELWYRENTAGTVSRMLRRVQDTSVTYSPLPTGKAYAFKVRAYTDTKSSAFSPEVVFTTPTDAVPPPVPSLPTTTSTLGVITVAWDGKSDTGGAMPFDFDHVDVYQQQGAVALLIDSLSLKGFTSIGGLTAGQTYNFALRSVDKTGNASPLTAWVPQSVVSVVYTTQISDAGITAPKIATNAILADHIQVGALDGMLITAPIIRTNATGQRSQFDTQGLRLWNSANAVKLWANPATGQLRIYNTTDASHTSTGHGIQFGDDTGTNLVIDNSEIMTRSNGGYSQLLLNREGGPLLIGGIMGGFPTEERDYPNTGNHLISLRGQVLISNTMASHYADERPPLMIGRGGRFHMWFDSNDIGVADGDVVAELHLNPPAGELRDGYHNTGVVLGASSVGIRRGGTHSAGDRQGFIYAGDPSVDVGLRLDPAGITAKLRTNSGFVPMIASSFIVGSAEELKEDITNFDPLPAIRNARSKRWKYREDVEPEDVTHFGPMVEDLPVSLHRTVGEVGENTDGTTTEAATGYAIGDLLGVQWEAIRLLIERVEELENRPYYAPPAPPLPPGAGTT